MGMNNRQRRAAKARQRAARGRSGPHRSGGDTFGRAEFGADAPSADIRRGAAILALRQLLLHRSRGYAIPGDLELFAGFEVDHQASAVDDELLNTVRGLVTGGWTPNDLREIARRRVSEPVGEHLLGTAAELIARHNRSEVDADWLAQLAGVRPAASSRAWASRHHLAWPDAREQLIGLLTAVVPLPRIEQVLPPLGTRRATKATHAVDDRVLRKVRALLAKAESTEFDDEADALTAKAQQLMTEHAIERALADASEPVREVPAVRRLWLDAPYVDGKVLLVNEVAEANRVRCVYTKACGFVTLVGFAADLDTVELLTTSLLVQATRAMRASGSHTTRYGSSRTRSFRQAFLVSFAVRIGERLRDAANEVEAEADRGRGGGLVPVLSARDDAVRKIAEELFPELVTRPVRVSNAAGWTAGRVAADLASLHVRDAIDRAG